jgi:hypothetical protein
MMMIMNTLRSKMAALALVASTACVFAADFTVTTPGGAFHYTINGAANSPSISLVRGRTYTFAVNTSSFHPFEILSTNVVNNNTANGTITFTVPHVASNYTYRCGVHTGSASLRGTILTVPPPTPPTIRVVGFDLGSNLVLRSTGTNTFTLIPEYNTNLNTTNWFALTVQSNRFANGTNETFCGRPPGSNVFVRIRATAN